ncbi:alpha-mannosidase [Acidipila sp. EB88]|nr:alpha-mannosidase [Acidipila sp. EB88]
MAALCISGVAVPSLTAHAQEHHEAEQALIDALPPAARTVVDRLDMLDKFEASDWRYHVGDIPHGESITLDDASWQTVQPKSEAPKEAVWYRRTIEIPKAFHGYDATGTRITFRFRASAHGDVPEIVYFNGRRVALGADLEPIVLTESAKPGERILIAVKLLQTAGPKTFRGAMLHVDYPADRPNPSEVRAEALSAMALIPSLSKDVNADKATVEKALAAINLKALDMPGATARQQFDTSLHAAQTQLEVLRPMLQQVSFHETGNSHIDAAWLWPATETVDVVRRTFGTAAQLLNEYPKYTYTQSAAQYNEWMANKYPELNDQIKQDIQAGRWEIVGGMWVEPDLNLPDGESLVRSILIGKRFYQKEYGVDVHIGWNPDSFGYNWQLPQIYLKSGIDTFVTQKMEWNDTNQLPFKLFWWQSPDGSKVLTYFPHGYGNQSIEPIRLSTDLATARKQAPGLPSVMDLYGVGDHGGGPTRAMLDEGMEWAKPGKVTPNVQFGTADSYFKEVRPKIADASKTWNYASMGDGYTYPATAADQVSIPTWNDELYLEYHRGVYTTQAKHKLGMRNSEIETLDAEKLASLAWLGGTPYPADTFTDAWKNITFNDFHDLAAGSGIAVIYRDAQKEFDTVRRETSEISDGSLKQLAASINTSGKQGVPVLVWNPLAWERSGLVTVDVQLPETTNDVSVIDAEGKVLPSEIISSNAGTSSFKLLVRAEKVPSLGYAVLHVVPGKKSFTSDVKADGLTLENGMLRVKVDPATGCITSLYDKGTSFETLAAGGCGNELQAFKDTPKDYDAWNIDPGTLDVPPTKLNTVESVKLVENTPLRSVIRIQRKWQSSTFTQDVALSAGSDHVVVTTDVDWRERHILLKAAFPLAATSKNATYEIPYGSIERPTTRNNSFEKGRFEVPALRWADEGDAQHGFSLLNNSKYGYDAVGNVLRLSLLRSPTSPDAEADQGAQHFTYALYPHAADWKKAGTVEHGYEFNYPMQAMQVEAHAGALPAMHSYAAVDSDHVVLTAMKKAEDSDALVLRMYESAGKEEAVKVKLPPGASSATITNLMENKDGASVPVTGDVATVSIHPYEILSLKVTYTHNAR